MKSPRICIDCSPLLVRSAGVKTYLYHWLRAMRVISPTTIQTFLAPGDSGELFHEGGIRLHPRQMAMLIGLNALPQIVCEMTVPRCDIFHTSNLLRVLPKTPRLSATIHDLTAWIVPDCHTPVMVAADKAFAERVLKPAAGLIAVSENSRNDAIRILGLRPDKIRVIPLGIPDGYRAVSPELVATVQTAYKLKRPYFLFVGTIEPRKNVGVLLDAWMSLPASFRAERELLIVGAPGWRSEVTMRRLMQAAEEQTGVRYMGYVPETHLPGLTAGARALLCPSLYEGFGIPVAQAMAAGCPVVTSDISSLPEITAGAAILIDPRSVSELAAAIRKVDESEDLRVQLTAAGINQSSRYTWEAAAAASIQYFQELA